MKSIEYSLSKVFRNQTKYEIRQIKQSDKSDKMQFMTSNLTGEVNTTLNLLQIELHL